MNIPTDLWSIHNTGAAATAATASKAAGAAGVKHVALRAILSLATIAATAQTPLTCNLRDGATGAGTVLASWTVAALGTTFALVDTGVGGALNLVGTDATAMTIEFAANNVANSVSDVTLIGYDLPA